MTLRGTVHISQSDFSLLYPHVCSLALKMVANPRRALDLNINASLEFLSHVLPPELAQVNRAYKNENLLESELSPLDRIPSTQLLRPDDDWIAARLKIKHEWVYRTSPKLFRKLQRRKFEKQGRSTEVGGEVWLHVKPTHAAIEQYLEGVKLASEEDARPHDDSSPPTVAGATREENGPVALPMRLKSTEKAFINGAGDAHGDVEFKSGAEQG